MNAINHQELRELAIDLQRNEWQRIKNYWRFVQCSRRLPCWHCWMSWSTPEPCLQPFAWRFIMKSLISAHHWVRLVNQKRRKQCNESYCNASTRFLISSLTSKGPRYEQKDLVSRIHVGAGMRPRFSHSVCRTTPPNDFIRQLLPGIAGHFHCHAVPGRRCSPFQ